MASNCENCGLHRYADTLNLCKNIKIPFYILTAKLNGIAHEYAWLEIHSQEHAVG
jgi:hypothetical protein